MTTNNAAATAALAAAAGDLAETLADLVVGTGASHAAAGRWPHLHLVTAADAALALARDARALADYARYAPDPAPDPAAYAVPASLAADDAAAAYAAAVARARARAAADAAAKLPKEDA